MVKNYFPVTQFKKNFLLQLGSWDVIYKDFAQLETFGEKRKQIEFNSNKENFKNYYEVWKAIIANDRV